MLFVQSAEDVMYWEDCLVSEDSDQLRRDDINRVYLVVAHPSVSKTLRRREYGRMGPCAASRD